MIHVSFETITLTILSILQWFFFSNHKSLISSLNVYKISWKCSIIVSAIKKLCYIWECRDCMRANELWRRLGNIPVGSGASRRKSTKYGSVSISATAAEPHSSSATWQHICTSIIVAKYTYFSVRTKNKHPCPVCMYVNAKLYRPKYIFS